MAPAGETLRLSVVLFDGFELLDVFGPVEIFGLLPEQFQIELLGPDASPVRSAQGPLVIADQAYGSASRPDIVLVPGGIGTRTIARDPRFLSWLAKWAASATYVTSVCTGSGVLAAAGLLDGYRATSNKRVFDWAQSQGPKAEWIPQARWVEDRNRWTSSGVTAGIDMALALVGHLHGTDLARRLADAVEHEWHEDPDWDPFAAKNGLARG